MYNTLVETCFDKCVMTEWGGVSFTVFRTVQLRFNLAVTLYSTL
jgi:hypothetical protein